MFRMRYKKTALVIIHRMYKIIIVLYKTVPFHATQEESIFEKLYCLQSFLQALSHHKFELYLKTSQKEVESLLETIA